MIDTAREIVQGATRIVTFSGAGLSAESGVPTFRDAASGELWARFDPTRLASPQGFAVDPELVIAWYGERRRGVAQAKPNAAHHALAGRTDVVHVTQNVDDLLHRAGARGVIHLHGTLTHDRCHAECGYTEPVDLAEPPPLRPCPQCGDRLRPAVVWFGEPLPAPAWAEAETACRASDVLLVIGTSAEVYPAASLIDLAKSAGARIVIVNTNPSSASGLADAEVIGRAGDVVPELLATPRG